MTSPAGPAQDNPMLAHALAYARHGLRVMPVYSAAEDGICRCQHAMDCQAPGKHPILVDWPRKATTDETSIAAWWRTWPWANIGVALGGDTVVIDYDSEDEPEWPHELRALRGANTWVSRSGRPGGGGRHVWLSKLPTMTIKPPKRWPKVDVLAEGRLAVVPPSVHVSGNRYEWIHDLSYERAMLPDSLLELLGATERTADLATVAYDGPGWRVLDPHEEAELRSALSVLDAEPREQWVDMACALKATGAGEQAYRIWEDWSRTCPSKFSVEACRKLWPTVMEHRGAGESITEHTIFYRAREQGWTPQQVTTEQVVAVATAENTEALQVEDLWSGEVREPDWLIDEILARGEALVLFGASGSGKTFAALDICGRVSHGAPIWGGVETQPAHVLYVTGEGGVGLRNRVAAWQFGNAELPAEYVERRHRFDRVDMPELSTDQGFVKLYATVQAAQSAGRPYGLVVLDTLSWALGALDENKASDVGQVFTRCRRLRADFGCAMVLVHHAGKGGVVKDGMEGLRGSSAIYSNCDDVLQISKRGNQVRVYVAKVKEAEHGQSYSLEFVGVDLGRTKKGKAIRSAYLRQIQPDDAQRPAPACEVETDLQRWLAHLRSVADEAPDGWTQREIRDQVPAGMTNKQIRALLPAAIAEGHIVTTSEPIPSGGRPRMVHRLSGSTQSGSVEP